MSKKVKAPAKPQSQQTKVFDLLTIIICVLLILLGIYDISRRRQKDGLINLVIGVSLLTIPMSNMGFDYQKSPLWQKVAMTAIAVFVISATAFLIYLGFRR